MQLLINRMRGVFGEIPETSMSGTCNDDRYVNSMKVLYSYLYIASGIVEIAN